MNLRRGRSYSGCPCPHPSGPRYARSDSLRANRSNRRVLIKSSTPLIKREAPRGGLSLYWRRGRDSNPRYAINVYTLSRRAPSTARPPLPLHPLAPRPRGAVAPPHRKGARTRRGRLNQIAWPGNHAPPSGSSQEAAWTCRGKDRGGAGSRQENSWHHSRLRPPGGHLHDFPCRQPEGRE